MQPDTTFFFHLNDDIYHLHEGKVSLWLRNMISVDNDSNVVRSPTCWRSQHGAGCQHHSTSRRLWVHIPVMLVIEVTTESDHIETPWDFPAHLYPITKEKGTGDGVVYDLVGRVLHSPADMHFVARFVDHRSNKVVDYNDRSHTGWTSYIKNATVATHLAGAHIPLPQTYTTHAVVYHLRGGIEAQNLFFQHQKFKLQKAIQLHLGEFDSITHGLPDIELRRPDVRPVPPEDSEQTFTLGTSRLKRVEYEVIPRSAAAHMKQITGQVSIKSSRRKILNHSVHQRQSDQKLKTVPTLRRMQSQKLNKKTTSRVRKSRTSNVLLKKTAVVKVRPIGTTTTTQALPGSDQHDSSQGLSMHSDCPFKCRCGAQGENGHDLADEQDIVECDTCHDWSHIACQQLGRASALRAEEVFECDSCRYFGLAMPMPQQRKQEEWCVAKFPLRRRILKSYMQFLK